MIRGKLEGGMTLDIAFVLFLVGTLMVSVLLNVSLFIRLRGYKLHHKEYKPTWKQVIGLTNPVSALLWAFLVIAIFLGAVVLVIENFN